MLQVNEGFLDSNFFTENIARPCAFCRAMASPQGPGDGSIMTCTACRLRLYGVNARNEHYRSDLHRVNLKRKVAGLGPLMEDEFQQRLEAIRNESNEEKRSRQSQFCEVCSKKFSSVRALENHNNSKRHRDALRLRPVSEVSEIASEDQQSESVIENEEAQTMEEADIKRRLEEAVAIPPNCCVFDGHESATLKDNLSYMASKFGFFLPYGESLVDLEGLLTYIGQKSWDRVLLSRMRPSLCIPYRGSQAYG